MDTKFRFEYDYLLWGLALIPLMVLLFVIVRISHRHRVTAFADSEMIALLAPYASGTRMVLKFIFVQLSLSFLLLAICRPQYASGEKKVNRKGVELFIALDVSNSMLAEDIAPNRLEAARRAIQSLIAKLENDRIGLILFAGEAFIQVPLTTDYGAVKMFLATANPQMAPVQGTALGAAIDLASNAFTPEAKVSKALILITDGENHEDNALETATTAAEKGIHIFTLGIGKPEGELIPIHLANGQTSYKTDKEGNTVVTKLNETILQQIATSGNGIYVRAGQNFKGLDEIYRQIEGLEKGDIESTEYAGYDELFQYFMAISLFFLILEQILLPRKNKYLKDINLFEPKTPGK